MATHGDGRRPQPEGEVDEQMRELPSGRQYTIVDGSDHATIVEVGRGLRSYVAGGRELLDVYREDEMATGARGQPLIPWPKRLRGGQYTWRDKEHQVPLSEPRNGNAIHGFLRFANWTSLAQTTATSSSATCCTPVPATPAASRSRSE